MQTAPPPNLYSRRWFATFLGQLDPDIVAREVAFLERLLPQPHFGRVLDLCAGVGRHAVSLARAGYSVLALDRDAPALDLVRHTVSGDSQPSLYTLLGDLRALPVRSSSLDAIICMWQSFGYYDGATNSQVLADCARTLRPAGRFIVDLYHRDYYQRRTGRRRVVRGEIEFLEDRAMVDDRLRVTLSYVGRPGRGSRSGVQDADVFEWRLYTPEEIFADARAVGLEPQLACSDFDETRPPCSDAPRMQIMFTRV